jgi:flavin-binding protein dodecin
MSDPVYKRLELVGRSTVCANGATCRVFEKVANMLRHVDWFELIGRRSHVADRKAGHFEVALRVGFRLEG